MPPPITRSKKSRITSAPAPPDREPELPETLDGQQSKLPPELLRNIVEEVALSISDAKSRNHALYTLMLTSRDLHPEARRLLYRDVTFVNKTRVAGQISDALHAGAATYVHSLRVESFDIERGRRGRSAKTFFYHLPLNRMDGLQSLVLWGPWTRDASEIADFLISTIPVNNLLKFHAVVPISNAILRFLQQQNKIQFLSLHCFDNSLTTSLRSLQLMPNLKRLSLPYILNDVSFQELVEERPITVFHLGSVYDLPTYWTIFAPRLHALDVSNYISIIRDHEIGAFIETLSTTAVNLRLFACFQVTYFPGPIPRIMPAGFRALSNFRHLEALSVSFSAASIGPLDVMTIPDVVSTPAQLKSIFVTRRMPGNDKQINQELQYDSGSGWTAFLREGMKKEDWFELYLRKLGLAYVC